MLAHAYYTDKENIENCVSIEDNIKIINLFSFISKTEQSNCGRKIRLVKKKI